MLVAGREARALSAVPGHVPGESRVSGARLVVGRKCKEAGGRLGGCQESLPIGVVARGDGHRARHLHVGTPIVKGDAGDRIQITCEHIGDTLIESSVDRQTQGQAARVLAEP